MEPSKTSEGNRRGRSAGGVSRVEHFVTEGPVEVPPHGHGWVHLCILLDGLMAEAHGSKTVILRRGDARISPSGDEHRIRFGPAGGRCALVFLSRRLLDDLSLEPPRERRFETGLGRRSRLIGDAPGPAGGLALQEIAVELLFRSVRRERLLESPRPRWLDSVRDLLHEQPESVSELADLAAEAGVHPGHLTRAFRSHFGCSPSAYLRWRRLAGAAERITRTDEPLAAIAHSCGFSDQAHMTRWFRRVFGTTPGRARSTDVRSVQDAS